MKHLQAWKEGKTGYPIVDAAMRQMAHTGWMHNRCRMIVASFLAKDLLVSSLLFYQYCDLPVPRGLVPAKKLGPCENMSFHVFGFV